MANLSGDITPLITGVQHTHPWNAERTDKPVELPYWEPAMGTPARLGKSIRCGLPFFFLHFLSSTRRMEMAMAGGRQPFKLISQRVIIDKGSDSAHHLHLILSSVLFTHFSSPFSDSHSFELTKVIPASFKSRFLRSTLNTLNSVGYKYNSTRFSSSQVEMTSGNDVVDPELLHASKVESKERQQEQDQKQKQMQPLLKEHNIPVTPSMNLIRARNPDDKPINIIRRYQKEGRPVFVAGPMVRYSKLPFRKLVRDYKCDIVYSPMILAREFVRNENARLSDFTTNNADRPLIVQVGVNNVTDLMRFVEMVQPYVDGIGINCGCPIKEQVREGIGAALMSNKDLVSEMVYEVKKKWGDEICIETKIRVHDDINETIEFVKQVEKAGVDFITVHGRTKNTRSSQPANFDKIRIVKENVSVPVIANGDCFSLKDAYEISEYTKCDGVMAVRGVLNNPAMFAGYEKCPWGAIERFWDYATAYGLPFRLVQHHLSCMMEGLIERKALIGLNECNDLIGLLEWFDQRYDLKRPGEEGFGTSVSVPVREDRSKMANL